MDKEISRNVLKDKNTTLAAFSRTLQRESHVLKDRPDLLWQQLYNRLQWEDEPIPSLIKEESNNRKHLWIKRETPFYESEALINTLVGHAEGVHFCAVSPDGNFLISTSFHHVVIWDLKSGTQIREFRDDEIFLDVKAITHNGKRLITTSISGKKKYVISRDLLNDEDSQILMSQKKSIYALAISNDGRYLFVAKRHSISVLDLESGQVLYKFKGFQKSIRDILVTPDNQFVILKLSERVEISFVIWDFAKGNIIPVCEGITNNAGMLVTPNGENIITYGEGIQVRKLRGGEIVQEINNYEAKVATITPDGQYLVTASSDSTIDIWDIENGEMISSLSGHSVEITALTVSPDGKTIISGDFDSYIKIWEMNLDSNQLRFDSHPAQVNSIAIAPDGSRAISGAADGTLLLWDLNTSQKMLTLEGHTDSISSLAVTPDNRQLISASFDKSIKLWDLITGDEIIGLHGHLEPVSTVNIIPGGTHAISSSADKTLRVWNLESGRLDLILDGMKELPVQIEVTADGRYAVSLSRMGILKVWDLINGNLIHEIEDYYEYAFALTPDCECIVTWPKVYDLHTGEVKFKYLVKGRDKEDIEITEVKITMDGKYAIYTDNGFGQQLMVCDLLSNYKQNKKEDKRRILHILDGHRDDITQTEILRDGRHFLSASSDNTLRLWDLVSGEEIGLISGLGRIYSCALSPRGNKIVVGDQTGKIHIVEIQNFNPGVPLVTTQLASDGKYSIQCVVCQNSFEIGASNLGEQTICRVCSSTLQVNNFTIQMPQPFPTPTVETRNEIDARLARESDSQWLADRSFVLSSIAISTDYRHLIAGSHGGEFKIWDLEQDELRLTLQGDSTSIRKLVLTTDNRYIVSGSRKAVSLWNLKTGEKIYEIEGHKLNSDSMAITVSSDNRYIFTAGDYEPKINVWDLPSGNFMYSLEKHSASNFPLYVTPDCQFLISRSNGESIDVWDLAKREHLYTLQEQSPVSDYPVTPDSRFLISEAWSKLKIIEIQSGIEIHELEAHKDAIHKVILVPDGKRIISSSWEGELKIWDLEIGKLLLKLEGHSDMVEAMGVTPDQRSLVSISDDNTMKVWDIASGEERRTFQYQFSDAVIHNLILLPDNSRAIVSSDDNIIRIWNLDSGEHRIFFQGGEFLV